MNLIPTTNGRLVKSTGSLLDDFFGSLNAFGKDAELQQFSRVPVNIHETEDAFHLELSVPGIKKEEITIDLKDGLLTIGHESKKETEEKNHTTIRREFSSHSFKRSFTISDKIDADKIEAKYEDGILRLLLPKKAEAKISNKQISIQ